MVLHGVADPFLLGNRNRNIELSLQGRHLHICQLTIIITRSQAHFKIARSPSGLWLGTWTSHLGYSPSTLLSVSPSPGHPPSSTSLSSIPAQAWSVSLSLPKSRRWCSNLFRLLFPKLCLRMSWDAHPVGTHFHSWEFYIKLQIRRTMTILSKMTRAWVDDVVWKETVGEATILREADLFQGPTSLPTIEFSDV